MSEAAEVCSTDLVLIAKDTRRTTAQLDDTARTTVNQGPLLDVAEGKDGRLELSPVETGQVAEESEEHPIAELRPIILAHCMAIRELQTTDDDERPAKQAAAATTDATDSQP